MHFGDPQALDWLTEGIAIALSKDCTVADIEAAVVDHVDREWQDPRNLASWAERKRDQRTSGEWDGRVTTPGQLPPTHVQLERIRKGLDPRTGERR